MQANKRAADSLVNHLPLGVLEIDLSGKILYANKSHAQMLGLSQEAVIGSSIIDRAITKSEAENTLEYFQLALEDDQIPKVFYTKRTTTDGNVVNLRFDWSYRRNHQDEIIGFLCNSTNLSNAMETEHAVLESDRRYRGLIEKSDTLIFRLSKSGIIEYINPACTRIFGYKAADVVGRSVEQLCEDPRAVKRTFKSLVSDHYLVFDSDNFRTKEGDLVHLEVTLEAMTDPNGEIYGMHGIAKDVTEIKKVREQNRQTEKLRALGTLASGIAHDFNNIFNPVVGYAEMITDGNNTAKHSEYASRIIQSVMRAKELTSHILRFSRNGVIEKKPENLRLVVEEVLKFTSATFPQKLRTEVDYIVPELPVLISNSEIYRSVLNLLVNANHAMDGAGVIKVSVDKVSLSNYSNCVGGSLSGEFAVVGVSDHGPGMSDAVQKRIFEPFFSTKSVDVGTGLGLATVFGVVQEHDGGIEVISETGKGATFKIFLPLSDQPISELETFPAASYASGSEHILFVDDDEVTCEMAHAYLGDLGFDVTLARNGTAALETFKEKPQHYDLVITDQVMPEMAGSQLVKELKEIRSDLPIILCSGNDADSLELAISERFSVEIQEKPVRMAQVANLARKLIDGRNH